MTRLVRPVRAAIVGAAVAAVSLSVLSAPAWGGPERPQPDRTGTRELAQAPVLGARATAVRDSYIVVMKAGVGREGRGRAQSQAEAAGGEVTVTYDAALTGFAATLPSRAVEALRRNPQVALLERDQRIELTAVQRQAPWGLDRIDQRGRKLNGRYRYDRTGDGVTAYVIDTGIRRRHREFRGRVGGGFSSVTDGRGTNDCNGHGTHVAGTVGGTRYGVAKQVTLQPVRVLGCNGSGSLSRVIAGVDWVTDHHTGGDTAVANMSLGGGISQTLDAAVARSIADGVVYVAAAGNANENACDGSPSRLEPVLTVGATTKRDRRAGFSNYGPCLDIFAPGARIASAWHSGNRATKVLDGTSMAAPHVAGAVALYLERYPSAEPDAVSGALVDGATSRVRLAGPGSPNRLLFSRVTTAPAPAPANLLLNPGFESGPTAWATSSGSVITNDPGAPARQGSWKAWLRGWGVAGTDELSQTVTIPSAPQVTLSFWLWVASDEGSSGVWDTLDVDIIAGGPAHRVARFSNADQGPSYERRTFDVSEFAGQTVTLRFRGTEDEAIATHFLIDDVLLTTD